MHFFLSNVKYKSADHGAVIVHLSRFHKIIKYRKLFDNLTIHCLIEPIFIFTEYIPTLVIMPSLLDWVHGEICSEMGHDTPTAYAEYVLEIGSLKEVKEYIEQLYGPGYEDKVKAFVKNFQIRKSQQDENMTIYRKGGVEQI